MNVGIKGLQYECKECNNTWFSKLQVENCIKCGSSVLFYSIIFKKE